MSKNIGEPRRLGRVILLIGLLIAGAVVVGVMI
ncbi:MAG: hypothetical protein QOC70_2583, partial [Verrucomicrobiota bacterium]